MKRFVMRCPSCAAPVADSLKVCPYCSARLGAAPLGQGVKETSAGRVVIDGANVVVGADSGERRLCAFCGAQTLAAKRHCAHCGAKLVIETLFLRSLVISKGGSLTVTSGGSVTIGRPGPVPALADAARANDVKAVRARIDAGDELDGCDPTTLETPLVLALEAGALDAATLLIAMGANLADATKQGLTPLHVAARRGLSSLVEVLLQEGADPKARTRRNQTPADLARAAGHHELATRLS